jgi:hypothetical protein
MQDDSKHHQRGGRFAFFWEGMEIARERKGEEGSEAVRR